MERLRFDSERLEKPPTRGIDVETTLGHFAIVTVLVEPSALRPHVHPRFELDEIVDERGRTRALVSIVPFLDIDFRLARMPWPTWSFGQTNYRAYVRDLETGEHVAWFFGTSLDTLAVLTPRHLWKLPWHRGRIRFDCTYDQSAGRYSAYSMSTESRWAPANLELEDTGSAPEELVGFADLETGLVLLTHPTRGFFHRRDGKLGTYRIWHDRLEPTMGRAIHASFPLLARLGLTPGDELEELHSVLMQHRTDFTIYLPPRVVE